MSGMPRVEHTDEEKSSLVDAHNQIKVQVAVEGDLAAIADINAQVFLGHRGSAPDALKWVTCLFRAHPIYQYYVLEVEGKVRGYIGWQQHGGFLRAEPVVELDQIGIDPALQGQKLGPKLVDLSLDQVIEQVRTSNNRIESHITVIVWGYALNLNAMSVYAKKFTDGVTGMRIMYGNRAENMLRLRIPLVRPVRDE